MRFPVFRQKTSERLGDDLMPGENVSHANTCIQRHRAAHLHAKVQGDSQVSILSKI